MRPLFKDPDQQTFFETHGYAILPIFNEDEVRELTAFYHSLDHGEVSNYFYCSFNTTQGAEFMRRVNHELLRLFAGKLDQHFDRGKLINTTFLVKKPNPQNGILPHQDWTVVDESRFNSVTAWVPFVDVDRHNGTLGVLDGSHRFFNNLRGSPLGKCRLPYSEHMVALFSHMRFPEVKAGESIVFDNRTLHASLPNASDQLRIAAGFGVTQEEAELVHHYLLPDDPEGRAYESYEIDDSFFMNYNNQVMLDLYEAGKKPQDLNVVGGGRIQPASISGEALEAMMQEAGNSYDPALDAAAESLFPSIQRPWAQKK